MKLIKVYAVLLFLTILIAGCVQTPTGQVIKETENQTQEIQEESICIPNWECSNWNICSRIGIQTRTCQDKSSCGINEGKPVERQNCEVPNSKDYALQQGDLLSEYKIKTKEEVLISKMPETAINLGIKDGYHIAYSRGGLVTETLDWTDIEQDVYIFPYENIEKYFNLKLSSLNFEVAGSGYAGALYELPNPKIGDKSIAYKQERWEKGVDWKYYIKFIKYDVYVEVTMIGSSTDYELLKQLAQKVADKINIEGATVIKSTIKTESDKIKISRVQQIPTAFETEYIEIVSEDAEDVNIGGWFIRQVDNIEGGRWEYTFPDQTIIKPKQKIIIAKSGSEYKSKYNKTSDFEFLDSSNEIRNMVKLSSRSYEILKYKSMTFDVDLGYTNKIIYSYKFG